MVPVFFPAGCMFLLSVITTFVELSSSEKQTFFAGVLIVVGGLAAFLNHETTWRVKLLSALMIVAAWFATGLLESHHTGFVPPIPLILMSAGVLLVLAMLAVFAGSAIFRFLIQRRRRQVADE